MKKMSKKVIFFGNEKLATGISDIRPVIREAVEKAGFDVEQHVTGKLEELCPHESKMAVLAAYGRIIPQSTLDEFPLGIINVHPSLLPQYRGPTPIETAILDGVSKTGVSIMRLSAGMDEGPLYKQKTVALTGLESKQELAENLQKLGAELLVDVLPEIASGQLMPRRQPHPGRATYSHLLSKSDGIMDLSLPAEQLERQVRAYLGWPSSRLVVGGKEVIVTKAHATTEVNSEEFSLKTSDGYLVIDRIKPAGKREMSGEEFRRGYSHLIS